MSTLTKISIVVLALLILVFAGPLIQLATTGPNWKRAYQSEKQRRELAEVMARNNMLLSQVWQRQYEALRDTHDQSIRHYSSTISSKDDQIRRLTLQLAECTGQQKEMAALMKAAQQSRDKQFNLNKILLKQLDEKRKENIKLSDLVRTLQDKIKENLANIEVLTKSVRVLQEQIAEREQEIARLRKQIEQGGIKPTEAAAVAPKAPKIEATVTAVKGDIASLNVGSASGVKKGMEFIIYRDAKFVANLRIAEVGVSSCAGFIEDAQRPVMVNDKATTAAGLQE